MQHSGDNIMVSLSWNAHQILFIDHLEKHQTINREQEKENRGKLAPYEEAKYTLDRYKISKLSCYKYMSQWILYNHWCKEKKCIGILTELNSQIDVLKNMICIIYLKYILN